MSRDNILEKTASMWRRGHLGRTRSRDELVGLRWGAADGRERRDGSAYAAKEAAAGHDGLCPHGGGAPPGVLLSRAVGSDGGGS